MKAEDYVGYEKWKSWEPDEFFTATENMKWILEDHFRGIPLDGRALLELGFGNGSVLSWARSKGARLFGTELNDVLRERARSHDITLLPADISTVATEYEAFFDVVAAFDVLEHLEFPAIVQMLRDIERILKPGGFAIFRFPNGRSPFGRIDQYGDYTHRTVLSSKILNQVINGTTLSFVREGPGPFRSRGNPIRDTLRYLKWQARRQTERYLKFLYNFDCDMSISTVFVCRKKLSSRVD